MRTIEVIYSPICEATGAMIETLKQWLEGTDIQIHIFPFNNCPQRLKNKLKQDENCFIEVFYNGEIIDSVPLHQDKIYEACGIPSVAVPEIDEPTEPSPSITSEQLLKALEDGEIQFHPINQSNYTEEMTMCLCNYPFGNPPKQFHHKCMAIKTQVFSEIWSLEDIAGIYATYKGNVIGLLEVMPREILRKYGYMTGTTGNDSTYLSIGCYEIGYGIPRIDMLDLLMQKLELLFPLFHRKHLEGVGIYDWLDGFNPYWVYEKYGFEKTEKLSENTFVMSKSIHLQ